MRREIKIPSFEEYDVEPSEYAGKEPEYQNGEMMMTTSDKKVRIMNYLKDSGLYVVMNIDREPVVSPAYKINPNKLKKIEASKEKSEESEKKLNSEEIKQLGEGMDEYNKGLKSRIDEIGLELKDAIDEGKIKELKTELEELKEQYEGLTDFVEAIGKNDFEKIVEKPIKK